MKKELNPETEIPSRMENAKSTSIRVKYLLTSSALSLNVEFCTMGVRSMLKISWTHCQGNDPKK